MKNSIKQMSIVSILIISTVTANATSEIVIQSQIQNCEAQDVTNVLKAQESSKIDEEAVSYNFSDIKVKTGEFEVVINGKIVCLLGLNHCETSFLFQLPPEFIFSKSSSANEVFTSDMITSSWIFDQLTSDPRSWLTENGNKVQFVALYYDYLYPKAKPDQSKLPIHIRIRLSEGCDNKSSTCTIKAESWVFIPYNETEEERHPSFCMGPLS